MPDSAKNSKTENHGGIPLSCVEEKGRGKDKTRQRKKENSSGEKFSHSWVFGSIISATAASFGLDSEAHFFFFSPRAKASARPSQGDRGEHKSPRVGG
jgi:hypothetical protein